MATWTWSWWNTAGTPAWAAFADNATDKIAFFGWNSSVGASYGKKIYIGEWNDTMHLRAISGGTDDCIANHMTGIKYVAAGTCSVNHAATSNLADVTQHQSIDVNFADAGMSYTENSFFYAHGAATTDHPGATGGGTATINCKAAEVGASTWTAVDSSSTKLTLSNPSGASVDWYMIITISPITVGEKNTYFTWRIETDYY